MASVPRGFPASRPAWRQAKFLLLLFIVGCVLDDLTGPDEVFSDLGIGGDTVMAVGATQSLVVNVSDRTDEGPLRILWTSSDSSVFTVDNGRVTAISEGQATISARLTGPDLSQPLTRTIDLRSAWGAIGIEAVDSLTGIGETRQVATNGLNPDGDPYGPVQPDYASSDTMVFVVDSTGLLRSTGPGTATLTATLDSLSADREIRVRQVAGGITFRDPEIVFTTVGRDTVITVEVHDTRGAPIVGATGIWETSDSTAISIVAPGVLRSLRPAATTVTVTLDTVQSGVPTRVAQTVGGLTPGAGQNETAEVGTTVSTAPAVVVSDGVGNPIEGVVVTFTVAAGGGVVTDSVVTTDATGLATVGGWTLGTTAGENRLRASVSGGPTLEFVATGVAGPISEAQSLVTVDQDTLAVGAQTTVRLEARDQYDNVLTTGGASVAFATSGGTSDGTMGSTVDAGDGTYSAVFSATTSGTATTVGATIGGLAVSTPLPSLTVVPAAVAASLSIDSGDGQTAIAGSAVAAPIRVLAEDAGASPVANVVVTFSVATGGGSVQGAVVSTNAAGIAELGSWTLGTSTGSNTLTATAGALNTTFNATSVAGPGDASASLLDTPSGTMSAGDTLVFTLTARDQYGNPTPSGGQSVAFTASGGTSGGTFDPPVDVGDGTYTVEFVGTTAGSPTTISATLDGEIVGETVDVQVDAGAAAQLTASAGDGQSAAAGTAVSVAPSIQVLDAYGNGVAGQSVDFTVVAGGGSVSGGSTASGADGIASVGSWTLGTSLGSNVLRATAGTLTFDVSATSVPGPAAPGTSVATVSKDTVVVGEEITLTLAGRDVYDHPTTTGGATVAFAISGGSSGGTIGSTSDNGDGTYSAAFTGTTAGTPVQLSVTLDGAAVTTPMPSLVVEESSEASTLEVDAGADQTAFAGTEVTTRPRVLARDGSSNPVEGVVVTFTVTGGNGTLTDSVVVTDTNGLAEVGAWALDPVPGANSISASAGALSVEFTATGIVGPGSAEGSLLDVSVDTLAAGDSTAVTVTARDAFGNPLTTGGQIVAFSLEGGESGGTFGATVDNSDGTYTAMLTATDAGSTGSVTATLDGDTLVATRPLTVIPGEPAELSVALGDNQIVTVGLALPVAPTVELADAFGNPISGETVGFAVVAGGGGITDPVATTDTEGRAAVGSWTLGTTPGTNTLRATAGPLTVDIDATALVGAASPAQSLVTTAVGSLTAGDSTTLTLQTRDTFGNDVPSGGATVVFSVTGGGSDGIVGNTVDNGDGTYDAVFLGQIAGTATTVEATLDGAPVTTTLPTISVTPGLPDTLVVIAGSGQSAIVNQAVGTAPRVRVEDEFGNLVTGQLVTFTVDAGDGMVTGATVNSDAAGEAEVGAWVLGTVSGENSLLAVAGTASTQILATGLPDAGSPSTSLLTVTSGSVIVSELVTLTLTVRDQFGNPVGVGGQAVSFSQSEGVGISIGTIGSVTDQGDGTYTATFLGVTAGTPTTITATLDGELVGDVVQIQVDLP